MMAGLYPLSRAVLFRLPPEPAHRLSICALRLGLAGGPGRSDPPSLRQAVFGLDFPNPLGLAAGYDKDAEVPDAAARLGFGFVEVGTVTPRPQAGNPRPRLFRLAREHAVINRMGFNNAGLDAMRARLERRAARPAAGRAILGANLGANKDSDDRIADYVAGLTALRALADYFVVNVSSPNTPGLRGLQEAAALDDLLGRMVAARAAMAGPDRKPLLLKVAPDLDPEQRAAVAETALRHGIDGLVVGNTTIARDGVPARWAGEAGGLSGAPLLARSTAVLADFRRLTAGRLPLVGVGGIASGTDAYAKIRAGACLVQLYTGLVYGGPGLPWRIVRDLADCLARDGFATVAEAVGADVP
jgi:dihydroorotate dehydrogenase